MPTLQGITLGQTWVLVDLIDFNLGPDLTPTGGTRLEVMFEIGNLMVAREVDNTTGGVNFITGFPVSSITKVEFTLSP